MTLSGCAWRWLLIQQLPKNMQKLTTTKATTTRTLIDAGKILTVVDFYDGSVDVIRYTDKYNGQPTVMRQIKLAVGIQAGASKKPLSAIMRVKEGEDPAEVLAAMGLKAGGKVILDVDSLTKHAPSGKGAESSWTLRIHGAYNLEGVKA